MAEEPDATELLTVLREARSHFDADVERRLLGTIATTPLVVPVEIDPETGEVGVRASVNPDGSRHLLGFTSAEELARWARGTPIEHRVMLGRDLAALAKPADADALWIDPAGENGGRLTRDRVDLVAAHDELDLAGETAEGALELRTGPKPLSVAPLSEPPPDEAVARLRGALASEPGVTGAWLLAGSGPGAADVVLVVADDGHGPSPNVARALQNALPPGASADVYPISQAELERGDFPSLELGLQVFP